MGTNDITIRDQYVIEHFKNACENFQEISPELLADISKFIISLEDSHKNTALKMIADYIVSTMKMHILSLMTTLQNNAEQDDIWPEHCTETIEQVLPEAFRLLNGDISIHSLDELYTLAHITGSLQTLSITTSAAMAQNWLYNLVSMYHEELEEEHLGTKEMSSYSISIEANRQPVLMSLDFNMNKDTAGKRTSSPSRDRRFYLAS